MKKKILTLSMLFMSIFAFQSCIWWWGPGRPIGPIGPGGGEGPGGGGGGDIPEEVDPRIDNVVPDDIRDKMEDYMPIYNGTTPPTIDGIYLVSPVKLVYDSFDNLPVGWEDAEPMIMHFFNQNTTNNTLSYEMKEGDELTEQSSQVNISGSGKNFTVYFNSTGTYLGSPVKQAIVISGTKTDTGLSNVFYGNVVLNQVGLLPAGTYRVFKDGDGNSPTTTWPSSARALSGQSTDWSKSIFAVK